MYARPTLPQIFFAKFKNRVSLIWKSHSINPQSKRKKLKKPMHFPRYKNVIMKEQPEKYKLLKWKNTKTSIYNHKKFIFTHTM